MEELEREDRGGDHDDDDRRRERVFMVVGDGHFLCVSKQEHIRKAYCTIKWVVWYSVLPEDDTTIAYDTHIFPPKLGPVSTYHSRKFRGQKIAQLAISGTQSHENPFSHLSLTLIRIIE